LFEGWWIYRGKVLRVVDPPISLDHDEHLLLVKQFVLQNERKTEKLRREVETLENAAESSVTIREPIPESVRLFVWRRDNGQCVRCGSREHLEFDHIIPVSKGGSSTERNVQLLCESYNRSKGATL
jgi:5-methylcytosine-specific restriction endonuclease McrA